MDCDTDSRGKQVDQLDLSKVKATDLLREHDADVLKAMKTWVSTAV
jgi:hypothetical protein